VTRNVMLMHVFFVVVHGIMLAFMLHNPAMVKDSTCPPCAPMPQSKPCATVQAWQLHITPNTSVPTGDVCPPCAPCGPVPVCAKCAPVPQYEPCATVQAWQLHITPNTSLPKCDVCPPPVKCPNFDRHYDNCALLLAEGGY
jgi:hypothetical protein